MKTQFYKGQKVFDPRHGWGEIEEMVMTQAYPIRVDFEGFRESYTSDGRDIDREKYPILSTQEYHRPEPQWIPQKGELVWVRNGDNENWQARNFIRIDQDDGQYICEHYQDGIEGYHHVPIVNGWLQCHPFEPRPF